MKLLSEKQKPALVGIYDYFSADCYYYGIYGSSGFDLDQITRLKKVRRDYFTLSLNEQDTLFLAFFQSPGKFSYFVNEASTVYFFKTVPINLSALMFKKTKFKTIKEFEDFVRNNKSEYKKLLQETKQEFLEAFKLFEKEYKK